MTEIEKIAYAKSFIDKLANGVNPINDSEIPETDTLNNVRLSRCLFYVSDILRQVIENGGINPAPAPTQPQPQTNGKKKPYFLLPEQAEMFEYSDTPITATEIHERIVAVGPKEGVKRLPKNLLKKWLHYMDFTEEAVVNGVRIKRPTESGAEIGLSAEERWGHRGSYTVVLFNTDAQHFIIDNIDAVLSFDNKKYKAKMNLENQGKSWSSEEDGKLISLFNDGFSLRQIATHLKRGCSAIRIRLRNKGIDPDTAAKPEVQ